MPLSLSPFPRLCFCILKSANQVAVIATSSGVAMATEADGIFSLSAYKALVDLVVLIYLAFLSLRGDSNGAPSSLPAFDHSCVTHDTNLIILINFYVG